MVETISFSSLLKGNSIGKSILAHVLFFTCSNLTRTWHNWTQKWNLDPLHQRRSRLWRVCGWRYIPGYIYRGVSGEIVRWWHSFYTSKSERNPKNQLFNSFDLLNPNLSQLNPKGGSACSSESQFLLPDVPEHDGQSPDRRLPVRQCHSVSQFHMNKTSFNFNAKLLTTTIFNAEMKLVGL